MNKTKRDDIANPFSKSKKINRSLPKAVKSSKASGERDKDQLTEIIKGSTCNRQRKQGIKTELDRYQGKGRTLEKIENKLEQIEKKNEEGITQLSRV